VGHSTGDDTWSYPGSSKASGTVGMQPSSVPSVTFAASYLPSGVLSPVPFAAASDLSFQNSL